MGILDTYSIPKNCLDEVFEDDGKTIKDPYHQITSVFNPLSLDQFEKHNELIKLSFFNQGITYKVY